MGHVTGGIIHDVLSRVFGGSPSAMILKLIETADVDAEELAEVRNLIARKAKDKKQ
ncbi:MAG: BlaI/MecI/CopY family transcriptional regulator [Pirellulales bacterium]|nr:BlaI/MecI/CopY family transcriptional regulator [Pirellulales bacterium]